MLPYQQQKILAELAQYDDKYLKDINLDFLYIDLIESLYKIYIVGKEFGYSIKDCIHTYKYQEILENYHLDTIIEDVYILDEFI